MRRRGDIIFCPALPVPGCGQRRRGPGPPGSSRCAHLGGRRLGRHALRTPAQLLPRGPRTGQARCRWRSGAIGTRAELVLCCPWPHTPALLLSPHHPPAAGPRSRRRRPRRSPLCGGRLPHAARRCRRVPWGVHGGEEEAVMGPQSGRASEFGAHTAVKHYFGASEMGGEAAAAVRS